MNYFVENVKDYFESTNVKKHIDLTLVDYDFFSQIRNSLSIFFLILAAASNASFDSITTPS